MDCGQLIEDWILYDNTLAKKLMPIRKIAIKNYLFNSIDSYTRDERAKKQEEKFLAEKGGVEGLKKSYKKFLKRWGKQHPDDKDRISFEKYVSFLSNKYRDGIIDLNFDKYDYTSQKLGIGLLEDFTSYRQLLDIEETQFDNQDGFHITVEFIDTKNVSRYQVIYEITGRSLDPDILNSWTISHITGLNKLPKISLKDFINILPLKDIIRYYPRHISKRKNIFCPNYYNLEFNDLTGKMYHFSMSDYAFILFDNQDKPFRVLPIFDIIRPYLENLRFKKNTYVFLEDYYEEDGYKNDRYHFPDGGPNKLKHSYDNEEKTILFQICSSDRMSDPKYYEYNVYDIFIDLKTRGINVKINKNDIKKFYWDCPGPPEWDY